MPKAAITMPDSATTSQLALTTMTTSPDLIEKLIFTYGPMAAILLYMFWRDYQERKALHRKVSEIDAFILRNVVPLLVQTNKTIEENTSLFKAINRIIKELIQDKPTAAINALEKIEKAVERRKDESKSTITPVKLSDDGDSDILKPSNL
jgi:hypothetical protein